MAVIQQLEDQLQAERRRLTSMSGFLKIFKRRSVNAFLNSLSDQIAVAQEEEEGLLLAIEEIQNRTSPDTEGLDAASKRSINLMIVAFAQQLYLTFADGDLEALEALEAPDVHLDQAAAIVSDLAQLREIEVPPAQTAQVRP